MPAMGTRAEIEAGLARASFNGSLPRPASGLVTVTAEFVGSVTLVLTGAPDYVPSVGGWDTTPRIGGTASSWWKEQPLATISLPCLLHTTVTGPVERSIAALEKAGKVVGGHLADEPSRIKLRGDIPPSAAGAAVWRLDGLKLSAREYQPAADTVLWWQELTLDLTQHTAGTVARAGGLKTRNVKGARTRRTVRALQGDTIRKIALRELGSSTDWKLLRSWNKKLARTDPDAILAAGTHVSIGGASKKAS